MDISTLKSELAHFTGSESLYRHPLFGKSFTEGVKHMADAIGGYWLIDLIFAHQLDKKVKATPFQVWKITSKNGRAAISLTDGDELPITDLELEFTTFPEGELSIWYAGNTLYLPSEH